MQTADGLINKSIGLLGLVRVIAVLNSTSQGKISDALFNGDATQAYNRIEAAAGDFYTNPAERAEFTNVIIQTGIIKVLIEVAKMGTRFLKELFAEASK